MFNCSQVSGNFNDNESGFLLFALSSLTLLVSIFYFPACSFYFYTNRNASERTKRRNMFLLTVNFLGLMSTVINFSLRNILGAANYPCDIYFLSTALFTLCFCIIASIFRLIGLYFRISFNRKLLASVFETLQRGELLFKPGKETFRPRLSSLHETSVPISSAGMDSVTASSYKRDLVEDDSLSKFSEVTTRMLFRIFCWDVNQNLPDSIQLAYFLASYKFINGSFCLTTVVVMIFSIVVHFLEFPAGSNCSGCSLRNFVQRYFVLVFLIFITIVVSNIALRKYSDALGIKTELFVLGCTFVTFNIFIILPTVYFLGDVEESANWDWAMLLVMEFFFFGWFIFVFQVRRSNRKNKKAKQLLENVEDIMDSEEGTKAFALYLSIHLSVEHLYFYKAAQRWRDQYDSTSDNLNRKQARAIYELYIADEAWLQINLRHQTRDTLNDYFSRKQIYPQNVFDVALKEALGVLSSSVFSQFLNSKYYTLYQNKAVIESEI